MQAAAQALGRQNYDLRLIRTYKLIGERTSYSRSRLKVNENFPPENWVDPIQTYVNKKVIPRR
jgi:hypothetical protein